MAGTLAPPDPYLSSMVHVLGAMLPLCAYTKLRRAWSNAGKQCVHLRQSHHPAVLHQRWRLQNQGTRAGAHSPCSCYSLLLFQLLLSNGNGDPGDQTAPAVIRLVGPTLPPLLTPHFVLHCSDDGDSQTRLPLLVTASVDAIKLRTRLDLSKDMHMSGAVVWTGRQVCPASQLLKLLACWQAQTSLHKECRR